MMDWQTIRSYFQYSLFALSLAALEVFTRSSLVIYSVGHYQIPPTILGPTLFLSLLLEIALQPWLGWRLSLNPHPRLAWRWVLSGTLMMGIATLVLFAAPQFISRDGILWLFPATSILLSLGFAFSGTPYFAAPLLFPASLSAPESDPPPSETAPNLSSSTLTKTWNWVLAFRMSLMFLGLALGAILPEQIEDWGLLQPRLQTAFVLTFTAFFLAVLSSWRQGGPANHSSAMAKGDPTGATAGTLPRPRLKLGVLVMTFLFELGLFVGLALLVPFLIEVLRQEESASIKDLLKLAALQILGLGIIAKLMTDIPLANRQGLFRWAIFTLAIAIVWLTTNSISGISGPNEWLTFGANQAGPWAFGMTLTFAATISWGSYLWQRFYLSTWPPESLPLGVGYWRMVQRLAQATGSTAVGLIISWVGLRGFDPRIEERLSTAYSGGVVLYWMILAVIMVASIRKGSRS